VPGTSLPDALATAPATIPQLQERVVWLGSRFVIATGGVLWASSDGSAWAQLAVVSDDPQVAIADIASGGPGFVAVGTTDGIDGAAWTSTDLVHWSQAPDSPVFQGVGLQAVASGPAGLIAVGGDPLLGGARAGVVLAAVNPPGHAAILTSTDGLSWTRVSDTPSFDRGAMWDVAAGGPGYIAVSPGAECGGPCRAPGPLIWTSSDGRAWRLVDPVKSITPRGPGSAAAISADGAGRLAAVGLGSWGPAVGGAGAWASVDGGTRWTAQGLGTMASDVTDVAGLHSGGFVAVGEGIWSSADGQAWASRSDIAPDPPLDLLRSVSCAGDRCVAVGESSTVGPDGGIETGDIEIWIGPAAAGP